jgi:hypothetical protein
MLEFLPGSQEAFINDGYINFGEEWPEEIYKPDIVSFKTWHTLEFKNNSVGKFHYQGELNKLGE